MHALVEQAINQGDLDRAEALNDALITHARVRGDHITKSMLADDSIRIARKRQEFGMEIEGRIIEVGTLNPADFTTTIGFSLETESGQRIMVAGLTIQQAREIAKTPAFQTVKLQLTETAKAEV